MFNVFRSHWNKKETFSTFFRHFVDFSKNKKQKQKQTEQQQTKQNKLSKKLRRRVIWPSGNTSQS